MSAAVVLSGATPGLASTGHGQHHHADASSSAAGASSVGLLANVDGTLQASVGSGNYGSIVLREQDYSRIPALRQEYPNAKIYVYKDVAATNSDEVQNGQDDPQLSTGVGYEDALKNHPEWFLDDTNGKPVQWADYPGDWFMDIGNPSYQKAWADNVIAEAQKNGVDGVMLDDVDFFLGSHLPSGTTLAKYPTSASYSAAMSSFLSYVGARLKSAGLLSLANISFAWQPNWEPQYRQWVGDVDGVMLEHWMRPGDSSSYSRFGSNNWDYQIEQASIVQQMGKTFVPVTYGDVNDYAAQRYARASFLMSWNGGSSSMIWAASSGGVNAWNGVWTQNLGAPVSAAVQIGPDLWVRQFTNGMVAVNDSTSSSATVPVPAGLTTATGSAGSHVNLSPMSATLLQGSASQHAFTQRYAHLAR